MYKITIIALFLLSNSISFSQKTVAEIPFTMDRNLIIIPVKMTNNETQKFIFDTGTEGIMLLDSLADRYKYKPATPDTIVDESGKMVGLAERFTIPKFSVSGLVIKQKQGIKMPRQMLFSPEAVGIIGMQTFKGYLITLDYQKSKIILQKGALQANENTIPINLDHLLEAKVEVNNKEVLAHFDCGGAGYISIPKRWDTVYSLKAEPIFMTKGRTPMGDFEVYRATLSSDIKVGAYTLVQPNVNLITGDFFYSVNFGYEFFRKHLITIDTKNKLMSIKKLT